MKTKKPQRATRSAAISRESLTPDPQDVPSSPNEPRASMLQNGYSAVVSAGMQEEAAEGIDAGLRAALAG